MVSTENLRSVQTLSPKDIYSRYILNGDLFSYDPYDVWNTKIGQLVKKIYYKNKLIGIAPSAVLSIFDSYINNASRIGYQRREYPIVYAHKALIATELYRRTSDPELLVVAKDALSWLANNYSKGYSGYCWGINMPWVSKNGTYQETTPLITSTPYVLEALLEYKKLSDDVSFDHIIHSIFLFIDQDLKKFIDSPDELALSYSPKIEPRIVLNANTYAMFCYSIFYSIYPDKSAYISDKIKRLYNFLKSHQQKDGSWFYYADDSAGNFIDCFHSCFILKNLIKVNAVCYQEGSSEVIEAGYNFVKTGFFDSKRKLFKRFTKSDRFSLVQFDLYDNAEMLSLATLLDDKNLVKILHSSIEQNFFEGDDIYSQLIFPNKKINKNTLRWAIMPLLYAFVKSDYKPA